jgi:hypothetical protein
MVIVQKSSIFFILIFIHNRIFTLDHDISPIRSLCSVFLVQMNNEIGLLSMMFSFIQSLSRSIDLKVLINCSSSLNSDLTTRFRFDVCTFELQLDVLYGKTERETLQVAIE